MAMINVIKIKTIVVVMITIKCEKNFLNVTYAVSKQTFTNSKKISHTKKTIKQLIFNKCLKVILKLMK